MKMRGMIQLQFFSHWIPYTGSVFTVSPFSHSSLLTLHLAHFRFPLLCAHASGCFFSCSWFTPSPCLVAIADPVAASPQPSTGSH